MVLSRDEAGGHDSLVERFEYFVGGLELGNAFN
jgi:lysyl-tRNA synthetase class II